MAGHVLCERCSRIRDKSAILKSVRTHSRDDIEEVFFHSRNLRQLFESSAAGCHLCAIFSQGIDLRRDEIRTHGRGIVAIFDSMPLLSAPSPSKAFWITLRGLNEVEQAVIQDESDYSRIEELLARFGDTTGCLDICMVLVSHIDGTTHPNIPIILVGTRN